ncbi:flagellin [Congregibacter variabilis]|uniref:Flagellin n=1 Tax=Congregibacter variabilis TaxID=3081200 RepID=A0ABZ0I3D5_9GAMM|nr:flagellin [Congregibacter sp. IMCC43200]
MPQIINTNIPSLNSQRNLNSSQNDVATSLQRLSSGLRINSAKDDAAGLAITERFTAQIRGLNQAARNASDGISLAQTAEGDLAQITNNLQRIRELSVQSANATNSASDRTALQAEVDQLAAEIDRVAQQSNFNGVNLLDGTFQSQVFQVGANAGQTIEVANISSARTGALGERTEAAVTGAAFTATVGGGDLSINGVDIAASASAEALAANINAVNAGVTATSVATQSVGGAITAAATSGAITVNGVATALVTTTGVAGTDRDAVIAGVNGISGATGVTATANTGDTGITLTALDGRNITVALGGTLTTASTGLSTTDAFGSVDLVSDAAIVIAGTAGGLSAGTTNAAVTGVSVANIDISTFAGANDAIQSIDAALTAVNSSRADLGAIQNRFESVVVSLQTSAENLSASRSRIQDADFAAETANLARAQILQQAGIAVLAQANAQPQNVLALLQ